MIIKKYFLILLLIFTTISQQAQQQKQTIWEITRNIGIIGIIIALSSTPLNSRQRVSHSYTKRAASPLFIGSSALCIASFIASKNQSSNIDMLSN